MLRFAVAAALLAGATAASADSIEEKAALCSACHGANGLPVEPAIPIISGQNEGYLYLELRDFQKGARKDDRMTPIAQSLAKEDLLALAAYFSAKPWPSTGAPSASKADAAIAKTAINSVVCTSCHLEEFQGDSSVPRLADQMEGYLLKTMTDFRDHARGNNPGMSDLCNAVTPEQIAAIANYLAGL
jgi:cytochrome c553